MYFLQKAKFNALCPLSTDSTPNTTKNRTSSTWSLYLVFSTTSPLGFSLCLERKSMLCLSFQGRWGSTSEVAVDLCWHVTCFCTTIQLKSHLSTFFFSSFRTAHLPSHCLIPMRTQRGVIPSHFLLLLDRSPLRLQDCGLLLICRTLHNDSSSYRVHTVVPLLDVSCGSYHNHTYHIYLWTC